MKWITETRKSTLIGLIGGVCVLTTTALFSHDHPAGLLNLPGLIMVAGGTLAATLVSHPLRVVARVLLSLRSLMHDEDVTMDREVDDLLTIAHWYRSGNISAAERTIEQVSNPLLRTGAQLVIDREPLQDIVKVLQWHISHMRAREQGDAQILRTMAAFAPAFGMLGTLFGLMHMLGNLGGSGLTEIGAAMSFALSTTLYGLIAANMFCKPLAMKMERRAQRRITAMNLILEGIVLLHERRHPVIIRDSLTAYLHQHNGTAQPAASLAKAA